MPTPARVRVELTKGHPTWRRSATLALVALLAACAPEADRDTPEQLARLIDTGQASTALVKLKVRLQSDQEQPELRYLLGRALLETGAASLAEVELRRAQRLGHDPLKVTPALARSLLAQREARKLTDEMAAVSLPEPSAQAELKSLVASAYQQQGRLADAELAVAMALEAQATHAPSRLMQASLKGARGDRPAALKLVDEVRRTDPQNLQALILRGQLQFADGQIEAAEASFKQGLQVRADSVSAHAALVALYLARDDTAAAAGQWELMHKALPDNPQTRLLEAKLALRRNDPKRARELTNDLLRGSGRDVEALLVAASAEQQLQSPARAEALLAKAIGLAPDALAPRLMLGQLLMTGGQYEQAVQVLEPVSKGVPPSGVVLAMLAQAKLMAGDSKGADMLFARLAAQPKGARGMPALRALLRARMEPSDTNLGALREMAEKTDEATADLALISGWMSRGRTDQALSALENLARKQPQSAQVDELRGQLLLKSRKPDAAREAFDRALQRDPSRFAALAGLVGIDLAQGKRDSAVARLEAVRAKEPGHLQATLALAAIHARLASTADQATALLEEAVRMHPDAASARIRQVEDLIRRRQLAQAVSAAQSGVAAMPADPGVVEMLARAQVANGEPEQAIGTYSKLATLLPKSATPYLLAAEVQMGRRDIPAARTLVRRALSSEPTSLPGLRLAAALAVLDRQFAEALEFSRTAQSLHPTHAAGFLIEGEVMALQNRAAESERSLRVAITKAEPREAARRLHGLLLQQKRDKDAAGFAAQWMSAHPDDLRFLHHLGDRALAASDWAAADRHFRQVLKANPLDPEALNNAAWLSVRLGTPGGIELAQRALTVSPDNPAILDTLAQCLVRERQFDRAVETQQRALRLVPTSASFRLGLAKIFLAKGDHAQAQRELATLAQSNGKSPAAEEARQLLSQLKLPG